MVQSRGKIVPQSSMQRLLFWKDTLWRPGAKIVGLLYAMASAAQFLRDSFLPEEYHDVLPFIPSWSWYTWIIIGLVLALVVSLEGSYRVFAGTQSRLSDFLNSEFPDIGIEPQGKIRVFDDRALPKYSGPEGILFSVEEMRVFNRSDQAASIEIVFRVIMENERWFDLNAERKILPVTDEPLPQLINLGAKKGESGYIVFLLSQENLELIRRDVPEADLEYFRKQRFVFEVRDHITSTRKVFSASGEDLELSIEPPTSETEDS